VLGSKWRRVGQVNDLPVDFLAIAPYQFGKFQRKGIVDRRGVGGFRSSAFDAPIVEENLSRRRLVKEIMRLGRSISANPRDAVCRESACLKEMCQPGQGRAEDCACPDDFAPCDSAQDIRLEPF